MRCGSVNWSRLAQDKQHLRVSVGYVTVNADRTKYMVMSRDQNAGRSHSMKIDSSSIERVEEFRYWEQR